VTGHTDRVRRNAAYLGLTTAQATRHARLMDMRPSDWPDGLRRWVHNQRGTLTCGDAIASAVADWLKNTDGDDGGRR
jgi:hypothetical protein